MRILQSIKSALLFGAVTVVLNSLLAVAVPGTAKAVVVASTNVNIIAAPASVVKNALVGSNAFLFAEKLGFTTTADVTLDITTAGTFTTDPGNTLFVAGQTIDSYYLHFDLVSTSTASTTGSITFDTPILGIMGNNGNLLNSHGQLGASGTTYWTSGLHGIWDSTGDSLSLIVGLNTINYTFVVGSALDSIRILTAPSAVPLPAALPLFLTGLAGLGFVALRKKKAA